MDTEYAARQLRLIAEVVEIAAGRGIEVRLRGGWAMDFYLGEVTRDHRDVDWFVWADDAADLAGALVERGYQSLPGPPPPQVREFSKDDVELSFVPLARNAAGQVVVGGGPWAGKPWPAGMLDTPPGRIGQLQCAIISPAAQIEIKQMMPVWMPELRRRAKDADDIARLRAGPRPRGHIP